MKRGIIAKRRLIQALVGIAILIAVFYMRISLWYVVLLGVVTGLVFGKVFCRWMCPMGFLMELMMGDDQQQLYNYHKLGCPIAWISGALNRFSIFRVKRDENKCIDCGKCDKACYVSSLGAGFSLYKKDRKNSSLEFGCSKCLACVQSCPTNSLRYKA